MTGLWVICWALWSLTVWYQVNFWLPLRKEIQACAHRQGTLKGCNPDPRRNGRFQDLVWFCADCDLQVPLKLHRVGPTLEGHTDHSLWLYPHDKDGR